MLNSIIRFSIRNKLIIGLLMLALIGYGIYEAQRLPIDAVPDITDNQVQVITRAASLGAPDVERLITFPVEQATSNIPGLKELRSFSRFGLSVVTIVFEDGVDVYWARQQVTERLGQIAEQIPKGFAKPELGPVTTGLGEIYQYTLRPKKGYEGKYNATTLRTLQDWIVRRQLLGVKGVADVSSFGGYLKQYEVAVNSASLKSYGVTIKDIFNALESANQNTGGAYIEKGPTVLFIRSEGLVGNIADIQSIVVKTLPDGTPLLIRNVADVRLGHATRYGAMTYNGEGEVAGAVVMMLKGANSNAVIKAIKERIAQIQKTLPEGVVIDAFLDRTKMVNGAIGTVEKNLLEGAAIVLIVLILFLGNWRAGLLVASVIPFAMLIAVILMNLFGVSGNLMSLGALDFGLIVDGAVIIVEAIMHELATRKAQLTQDEMDKEVADVSARMRNAAIFGELIILIVYIPIFTLQGIEGKMFRPMAQTVAFALVGAFLLSLTYVPMMASLILSKTPARKPNLSARIMHRLEETYSRTLVRVLRFPKTVLLSTVSLFALAVLALTTLGGEFIPRLEEGDYAIETRVLVGSSLQTTTKAVSQASQILLDHFPEVIEVVGKIGSGEIPTDPMSIEAADIMVILKDKKRWTSARSFDELTEKMSKALEAVPGVTFGFQYPVQMRFNELMTGARQDVVCKIYGEDLNVLAAQAQKLGSIANKIDGVRDLYVEAVTGMPQIVVRYNRAAIAQYGVTIADLNNAVNAAFAGQASGQVFEGEKRFDLVVRLAGEARKDLTDVRNLLIPVANGNQIPLYQVADVAIEDGPNQIQRDNAQRRILVGFNVRGRDVESIVEELQAKVERGMKLPTGYYVTYGGAFENLVAAKKRLAIVVPIALCLIFLMLYFAFGSVRKSLLIYSAIPLSAIGGIFILAARGMPFSISAGIGFIALFGVVVLNGIVLIAEFNRLHAAGHKDVRFVVLEGSKSRLRPVLMTAAVASFGFLPMALSNGAGAEVQRPLATVVIGGLLTATALTLFVLPVLYVRFGKKSGPPLPRSIAVVLLLMLLCGSSTAFAQTPISLQAAIDTALRNNLSLRQERLNADYLKALRGTSWDIPQTFVGGEYGQLNSPLNDNKIGVSQTIRFPTVYARQQSLLNADWKRGLAAVAFKETDLKKQVAETFYEVRYLHQKRALLREADSIYAVFVEKARLRFKAGETSILEKTTAGTQQAAVHRQLLQVESDLNITAMQFRVLLAAETDFLPDTTNASLPFSSPIADTPILATHPYLRLLQADQEASLAAQRAERAKLLPDLSLGYFNQTFRGAPYPYDLTRFYGSADRFSYVQAGIGVPLFRSAQRARVRAAGIGITRAQAAYETSLQRYRQQYNAALQRYTAERQTTAYFEQEGLSAAQIILNTATLQFKSGDIDYMAWVLLVNQSIALRSDYAEAVRRLNLSIIELTSLTGKL